MGGSPKLLSQEVAGGPGEALVRLKRWGEAMPVLGWLLWLTSLFISGRRRKANPTSAGTG